MPSVRSPSVRAGVAAALSGFLTFLVLHHLWIVPIWFIAPVGAVMAAVAGAAVGLAYGELRPHLPRRPWTTLAVAAVFGAMLLPAGAIAEIRGPVLASGTAGDVLPTGAMPTGDASGSVVAVLVGLLGTAAAAGAGLGWLIGRTARAAGLSSIAALALAVGPGHNIPLLAATPAVQSEAAIIAVVLGVAAIVLVETDRWLRRRADAVGRD